MTKFQNIYQAALLSGASGNLSVVIVPQAVFAAVPTGTTFTTYPWVSINNVNPLTPYTNTLLVNGPFATTQSVYMAPDITNVRFLNTMNDLTSAGKLTVSVFYEPVNKNWALPVTIAGMTFN